MAFLIFLSLSICLAFLCAWIESSSGGGGEFDVCVETAMKKEECKKFLRFNLAKKNSTSIGKGEYFSSLNSVDDFQMYFPVDERVPGFLDTEEYSVFVDISPESADDRFNRFNRFNSLREYPVNKLLGDLMVLNESSPGDEGMTFIAPSNGDKWIFFYCAKPFPVIAGG